MKFTKIICIFFAVLFIVTAANSVVARQESRSMKIKDILKSGFLRSESRLDSGGRLSGIISRLLDLFRFPSIERNKIPDTPQEEEPEEEESEEEEPEEPVEEKGAVKGNVSVVLEDSVVFLSDVSVDFYLPSVLDEAVYNTRTIEDGSYCIRDVDEGVYIVVAIKEGYDIGAQEVTIDSGIVEFVNFVLNKKESVELDLDFGIQDVKVDEQIYGNSVSVEFILRNNGKESVTLSSLDLGDSLSVKITKPDSEVLWYGALGDSGSSSIVLNPGETHNKVVEIIDEDDALSKKGYYELQGFYGSKEDLDIELITAETPFEIKIDKYVVEGIADFSLRLFKDFLPGKYIGIDAVNQRSSETSFSPALLWFNLHMLQQGAMGYTYNEITDVLGLDGDSENVLNDIKNTYDKYLNPQSDTEGISISNAIWLDEDQEDIISQSYIDTLKEEYNYDVHSLDFSVDSEAVESLDTIEDWIRAMTNDMITESAIFTKYRRRFISTGIPLISSTLYLNKEWEKPFDSTIHKKFCYDESSCLVKNYVSNIPFMVGTFENLNYEETEDLQILDLPCSGDISMLMMLPKEGYGIENIAKYMNQGTLVEWQKSFSSNKWSDSTFDICIPKAEYRIDRTREAGIPQGAIIQEDMTENLKNMGINQAFSKQYADFSKIISLTEEDNTYLKNVVQDSLIQLNENGIEAAACIAVSMIGKDLEIDPGSEEELTPLSSDAEDDDNSAGGQNENTYNQEDSPDTIVFDADHPFSFIIHDKQGTILYMGTVSAQIIITPLVLDLKNDGIKTSDLSDGVLFDLNNDGKKDLTGWIAGKDDAFLALDLNQDGIIDNGGELFGDNTLLNNGRKASNGFEALAQYDTNKDLKIDEQDKTWKDLLLWLDINHNGFSEKEELILIKDSQVHEIYLEYSYLNKVDHGNLLRECSSFKNKDGSLGSIIDVWFKVIT